MPTAGTEGLVAMPWGIHPGQLIAFEAPMGLRAGLGMRGIEVWQRGLVWPSSGPNSNFPSRSFWSSLGFFFIQAELWHCDEGFLLL